MNWLLFRQDPALQTLRISLPIWLFVGLYLRLSAVDVGGFFSRGSLSGQESGFTVLLLTFWMFFVFLTFTTNFGRRCSRLSLGLPLLPRRVWSIRMAAIVVASLSPVALLTCLVALGRSVGQTGIVRDPMALQLGLHCGGSLLLMVFLLQVPWPRLGKLGGSRYVIYEMAVVIGAVAFFLLSPRSTWLLVLPVGIGLLLGWWVRARLPENFQVAPAEPVGKAPLPAPLADPSVPTAVAGGFNVMLLRVLWSEMHNHWQVWIITCVLALYGFLMTHVYHDGRSFLVYAVLGTGFVFGLFTWATSRMDRLDSLPVSRRILFPVALAPALLALGLGFGLWQLQASGHAERYSQVEFVNGEVQVPPEFWEVAWAGEIPAVTAPWGESHTPKSHPLFGDGRAALYQPYSCGEAASARYAIWQTHRAAEAVCGVPMREDLTDFQEALGPGLDENRQSCCFTLDITRGVGSQPRREAVAVGMSGLFVLGCLLLVLGIEGRRARPHSKVCTWMVVGFFTGFGAVVLGFLFGEIRGWSSVQVMEVLPLIYLRKAAIALPLGEAGLWGLAVAVLAVCYLVAQRAFLRAEIGLRKAARIYDEY